MKILTFIDGLNAGGAQRQIVGLSALLVKEGYDVKFLWYHPTDFYRAFLEENNVPYLQLLPKGKINKIISVIRTLLKEKPDVIIAYIDGPTMISCLLKMLGLKAKVIVSERNTTQLITKHVKRKFWLYKFADYIVPNSFSQTRFIEKNFPELKDKIHTITNYIDINYFTPPSVKSVNEKIQIVGVGRIFEQKNLLCYLDAIRIVANKFNIFEVHWYGKPDRAGNYEQLCLQKIKELNLEEVFFFEEPTRNIREVYQKADVFCLPSIYEGYPNVVCEAMCCGLPILTSDVCDNPLLVHHGKNGLLFTPLDSKMIAAALSDFLSLDKATRTQMGRYSRQFAEKCFSEDVFIHKYKDLF